MGFTYVAIFNPLFFAITSSFTTFTVKLHASTFHFLSLNSLFILYVYDLTFSSHKLTKSCG